MRKCSSANSDESGRMIFKNPLLLEQRGLLIKLTNPNRLLTRPIKAKHVSYCICKLHLQVAALEVLLEQLKPQERRDSSATLLTTS